MAKAIFEIGIASETKAAELGIRKGLIDPLEDAEEALTDLGKSKGPERLERELEDAQDQTEKLRKEIKRTADQIEDDFRSSSKAAKRFSDDAGNATEEFKSEARQNFSEVTSSFKGDMDSIQDLAQGTLGGLANGLTGPLGIAAGAGAVSIGLVGSAIAAVSEESERMKERVSENFREMAAEGIEAWESVQSQMQRLTDAYDEHEGQIESIQRITGLPFETIASAWAGNKEALDLVNTAYAQMKSELRDIPGATNDAIIATTTAWDQTMKPLNDVVEGYDKAREKVKQFEDQQSESLRAAVRDAENATVQVDALNNKLVTLADGTEILIESDTGKATFDLEAFKGDLDGVAQKITKAPVELEKPDVGALLRGLQRDANAGAIKIRVDLQDRYGRALD